MDVANGVGGLGSVIDAAPWMVLFVVGMVMTLRSLRSGEADVMVGELLRDEGQVPVTRGPAVTPYRSQGSRPLAWSCGAAISLSG